LKKRLEEGETEEAGLEPASDLIILFDLRHDRCFSLFGGDALLCPSGVDSVFEAFGVFALFPFVPLVNRPVIADHA
jgi:hypothetical protein